MISLLHITFTSNAVQGSVNVYDIDPCNMTLTCKQKQLSKSSKSSRMKTNVYTETEKFFSLTGSKILRFAHVCL
jgi:hypothetical protein